MNTSMTESRQKIQIPEKLEIQEKPQESEKNVTKKVFISTAKARLGKTPSNAELDTSMTKICAISMSFDGANAKISTKNLEKMESSNSGLNLAGFDRSSILNWSSEKVQNSKYN